MRRRTVLRGVFLTFACAAMVGAWKPVKAQNKDFFDRDGAVFSATVSAMIFLGAYQGVVENCGGDVEPGGRRLVAFLDLAKLSRGDDFSIMAASMFGGGMQMVAGLGCDVDKMRSYDEWATMFLQQLHGEFGR